MLKGLYAVAARRILLDKPTNTYSAIDIMESMTIASPPKHLIESLEDGQTPFARLESPFQVLIGVAISEDDEQGEHSSYLAVMTPAGDGFRAPNDFTLDFSNTKLIRLTLDMETLPVDGEGSYRIALIDERQSKEIAGVNLSISFYQESDESVPD